MISRFSTRRDTRRRRRVKVLSNMDVAEHRFHRTDVQRNHRRQRLDVHVDLPHVPVRSRAAAADSSGLRLHLDGSGCRERRCPISGVDSSAGGLVDTGPTAAAKRRLCTRARGVVARKNIVTSRIR